MAFAAALTEKRGPRVGDAASLWNFTPAPGWSREEVQVLRLCLMKHGVGQWMTILNTGLLPGKLIQQLNGQTQRLLGQQSLAAYTGLRVDVDRIRTDNEARTDATRKAGLIIYDGPLLTKEMKAELREEAQRKYGLTPDQLQEVDQQLEEIRASLAPSLGPGSTGLAAGGGPSSADDPQGSSEVAALSCLDDLTQEQLVQLLVRLRNRLAGLDLRLRNRLGAAVRQGAPAWAGEAQEAAMMEQDRAQEAVASTGGGGAAGAGQAGSGGGGGLVGLGPVVPVPLPPGVPAPFVRDFLAEATAGRVQSGIGGKPAPPAAAGSNGRAATGTAAQAGAGRKQRSKPSKPRAGSMADDGEEDGAFEDAENVGRPARGRSGAGAGAKRRAASPGTEEDGQARRGSRAKRPSARAAAAILRYAAEGEYDSGDDFVVEDDMDMCGRPRGGGRSATRGSARGGADTAEALTTLTAMGFTPRKARGALQECDFNVEAAVEWLFANCV